jgi:hypothetical protein
MQSILPLLVLVAVANANIVKSGGLKGAWADEIVVLNADGGDLEAPTIALQGSDSSALSEYSSWCDNFDTTFSCNITEAFEGYTAGSTTFQLAFQVDNELDYSNTYYSTYCFAYAGGWEIAYWTTVDDVVVMLPVTASIYSYDNTVDVDVDIRAHIYGGDYSLLITLWDQMGNWAQYTDADLADSAFTIIETWPDMIAPMVTGEAITEEAIVLGLDDTLQNADAGGQTIISVSVTDNYYYDATPFADRDELATGINQVWATITTGEDEDAMSVDIMLISQDYDDNGVYTYSAAIAFANFAAEADYVIQIWATDCAGNVGMAATTLALSVTFDDAMLTDAGGVFACQTLTMYVSDILTGDNEVTVTNEDESDYVYLIMACTEKTEDSDNYVAVAYTSDEYTAEGVTDDITITIWDYSAGDGKQNNFGQGVSWTYGDEDYDLTFDAPATSVYSGGSWTSFLIVNPGVPESSLWLSEVDTITSTGGIQRYNLAEGAASSVAPSVFAVAVAAAFALFRL